MSLHRECIMIHIGQAGVQMASPLWELFCLEHGILPNGTLRICPFDNTTAFIQTFFKEHELGGNFVPRALFIDMETACINQIRAGRYRHLYSPDSYIIGKEDAGGNFARGYYTIGREFYGVALDKIRKMAESCDAFQGFNFCRSIGGGSGSGFGSYLMDKICTYYGNKTMLTFDIMPSPKIQHEVVEPYNAILTNHATDGIANVSLNFDNESLGDICQRCLRVPNPNFTNFNRLLAHVISDITSMIRFHGSTLSEFQTTLVPFPRMRYPLVTYAPVLSHEQSIFEEFGIGTLIVDVFASRNQMVRCNTRLGKYMAMSLTFRGNVSPNEVSTAKWHLKGSEETRGRIRFVDWTPPGFKVNFCTRPPYAGPGTEFSPSPKSIIAMMNTTAISQAWNTLQCKFELMWKKRAFVHWYTAEGMEDSDFEDALYNISTLQDDYTDFESEEVCEKETLDLTVKGRKYRCSSVTKIQ